MKRIGAALAAVTVATLGTVAVASPASAAPEPIFVESECLTDWYVNPDEGDLLPTQLVEGLEFDGPSLVHHLIDPPFPVASLGNGTFEADVTEGVAPLFKVETTSPYSTLNYVGSGLWWSSKITAGQVGGQGNAQTPAVLAGLAPYTPQTTVFSFGVGYANDQGNAAVVSTITFGGTTYDLTCEPEPTTTETSTQATDPATTTTAAVTATLPVTGASTTGVVLTGAVLIVGGVALLVAMRKRRDQEQPQE